MQSRLPRLHGLPRRSAARRGLCIVIATVLAGILAMPATAAKTTGSDSLVRIERGRISADVREEVPVVTILAQVARGTGAVVLVRGELGNTRPQTFADEPIRDGIERLVAPNHLMVEFAPAASGVASRITRIRVFGAGTGSEKAIDPQQIGSASPAPADAAAARSAVAPFDGKLGWSYDDESPLPPVALRVRKVGSIFPSSGDEGINALGAVIENDPDSQVRAAALRALAQYSGESAYPLIQAALADDNVDVRMAAINAIDTTAAQPSAMLLDLVVNEDEDQRLRLAGLERLAPYRDRDEVRAVLKELQKTTNDRVRTAAKALLQ